jgi:hypothetical protein
MRRMVACSREQLSLSPWVLRSSGIDRYMVVSPKTEMKRTIA